MSLLKGVLLQSYPRPLFWPKSLKPCSKRTLRRYQRPFYSSQKGVIIIVTQSVFQRSFLFESSPSSRASRACLWSLIIAKLLRVKSYCKRKRYLFAEVACEGGSSVIWHPLCDKQHTLDPTAEVSVCDKLCLCSWQALLTRQCSTDI